MLGTVTILIVWRLNTPPFTPSDATSPHTLPTRIGSRRPSAAITRCPLLAVSAAPAKPIKGAPLRAQHTVCRRAPQRAPRAVLQPPAQRAHRAAAQSSRGNQLISQQPPHHHHEVNEYPATSSPGTNPQLWCHFIIPSSACTRDRTSQPGVYAITPYCIIYLP